MNAPLNAPGIAGNPLFTNTAGVSSPNPSAPGMQSQVGNWMNQSRPSIGQLVQEGERFAPKPLPTAIPSAPGVGARVMSALNPMPAVQQIARFPGVGAVVRMAKGMASKGGIATMSGLAEASALYNQTQKNTDQFREQTGIDSGVFARGFGFLQDVGNAATFGHADKAGNWLAGNGYTASPHLAQPGLSDLIAPGSHPATRQAIGQLPAPGVNSTPVAKIEQPDFMSQPGKGNDLTLPANKPSQLVTTQTSAPGVTRTQAIGSNVPLYSNMARPTDGFNTTPGLNGNVGNLSVVGIDKAAIERGTAATQDLNAYKEAMMRAKADGGEPEDYLPGGKRSGDASVALNARLQKMLDSPLNAVRNQAIAALTQQQQMALQNQQQQTELGLRAPGVQLDNASKAMVLQQQQGIAQLHANYLALNDQNDPGSVKRKAMALQILTMQGKTAQPKFTSHIVDQFGTDATGNMVRTGQSLVNVDQNGNVTAFGADGKPFGSNVLQGNQRKSAIADAQIALQQGHPPEEIARRLRTVGIDPKEAGVM